MAKRNTVIGIDLGTTLSVIAHVDATGHPVTILNSEGDATTPSVVLFDEDSIIVGKEALKAAALEPDRIADFPKRQMGKEKYPRRINGEYFPPEVIQALILEKLKADAEAKLGRIDQAVITVPAYFNEPRRKATQDAGQLAGLNVLDIINEPTAAAIAYGTQQGFLNQDGESVRSEHILVYDLGGGTFDVTLMHIDGNKYETLATAGDVFLGGLDWDRRLIDHVAEQFMGKHPGNDPRLDAAGLNRLQRDVEDVKRSLSAREKATVHFEHKGGAIQVAVTRDRFEAMTADLRQRTLFTVRMVLREAGMGWPDVTRLLLVGGSTRMPAIQKMLEEDSGLRVDRSMSADEAVAHGAAIYANIMALEQQGQPQVVTVLNVNSHDLGVLATDPSTNRPHTTVVIPRNTGLPVTRGKQFRTSRQDQRSIAVIVVEGGDSSGRNATRIGKCVIHDLPQGMPAGTAVEVFFRYQSNGRLRVRARIPDWDREAELIVERHGGLTTETMSEWELRLEKLQSPWRSAIEEC